MLSTIHFEHALPLLAELDLATLLAAKDKLGEKDADLGPLVASFAGAAKGRVVRRLAAVLALSPQELLEAEVNPELLEAKVKEQALRPFAETFQEVLGFFSGLAQPPGSSPVSSGTGRAGEEASPEAAAPGAPSPSGDS